MKYLYILLSLLMVSFSLSACSSDKDQPEEIEEEVPVAKPEWQIPANLHYSSMTVVMDEQALPIGVEASEEDLLGAFVNDECRGFVAPVKDVDDLYRCYLVIHATTEDTNRTDFKVELRYYSAQKAHIYESKPFAFEYDGRLGSISQSFTPQWK